MDNLQQQQEQSQPTQGDRNFVINSSRSAGSSRSFVPTTRPPSIRRSTRRGGRQQRLEPPPTSHRRSEDNNASKHRNDSVDSNASAHPGAFAVRGRAFGAPTRQTQQYLESNINVDGNDVIENDSCIRNDGRDVDLNAASNSAGASGTISMQDGRGYAFPSGSPQPQQHQQEVRQNVDPARVFPFIDPIESWAVDESSNTNRNETGNTETTITTTTRAADTDDTMTVMDPVVPNFQPADFHSSSIHSSIDDSLSQRHLKSSRRSRNSDDNNRNMELEFLSKTKEKTAQEQQRQRRRKRNVCCIIICIIIVALIGAIVGLVSALSSSSSSSPHKDNNDTEEDSIDDKDDGEPIDSIAEALKDPIVRILYDEVSHLSTNSTQYLDKNSHTAQRLAFRSFLMHDKISIDLAKQLEEYYKAEESSSSSSNNYSSLEVTWNKNRIIARFALATFFFATQGPYWDNQWNFLNRTVDECQWTKQQSTFGTTGSSSSNSSNTIGIDNKETNNQEQGRSNNNNEIGFIIQNGIGCGSTQPVTSLSFDSNNLQGYLPEELKGLSSSLEILKLTYQQQQKESSSKSMISNDKNGKVNVDTGDDDIDESTIISPTFSDIDVIWSLRSLRYLNLSGNSFTGELSSGIQYLVNLQHFIMDDNYFSGTIPWISLKGGNYKEISLQSNSFTGKLPGSIGRFIQLTSLNLSNNLLSGTIPNNVGSLIHLQELNLSNNSFHGTLPLAMKGLKSSLQDLNLSYNSFSSPLDDDTSSTSSVLHELTSLTSLSLRSNGFYGTVSTTLFNSLIELQVLDLSNNTNVTGPVPETIGALPNLQLLNISGTNLTINENDDDDDDDDYFCIDSNTNLVIIIDCNDIYIKDDDDPSSVGGNVRRRRQRQRETQPRRTLSAENNDTTTDFVCSCCECV